MLLRCGGNKTRLCLLTTESTHLLSMPFNSLSSPSPSRASPRASGTPSPLPEDETFVPVSDDKDKQIQELQERLAARDKASFKKPRHNPSGSNKASGSGAGPSSRPAPQGRAPEGSADEMRRKLEAQRRNKVTMEEELKRREAAERQTKK